MYINEKVWKEPQPQCQMPYQSVCPWAAKATAWICSAMWSHAPRSPRCSSNGRTGHVLPHPAIRASGGPASQSQSKSKVVPSKFLHRFMGGLGVYVNRTCFHNGHWGQWIQLSAWPAYQPKKIVNRKQKTENRTEKTENESSSQAINCVNELLNTSWHVRRLAEPTCRWLGSTGHARNLYRPEASVTSNWNWRTLQLWMSLNAKIDKQALRYNTNCRQWVT